MLAAEHPQGVGALQPGDGRPHGRQEVAGVGLFNQVGDHLGIGFGQENDALLLHLLFERRIVFNDTVVYHSEPAACAAVGMGVLVAGLSVGRPTGMPNPRRFGQAGTIPDHLPQHAEASFRLVNHHAVLSCQRDAG